MPRRATMGMVSRVCRAGLALRAQGWCVHTGVMCVCVCTHTWTAP